MSNTYNEKDLIKELWNCRNELCLRCGKYENAHRGACDDCRYNFKNMEQYRREDKQMSDWGISENASEKEKLKAEVNDYFHGLNAVGDIDWIAYSELYDACMPILDRAYNRMREEESENDINKWDKTSSKQEDSEQFSDETFNDIHDYNDGIFDPTYINDTVDCSDLGIYPWRDS